MLNEFLVQVDDDRYSMGGALVRMKILHDPARAVEFLHDLSRDYHDHPVVINPGLYWKGERLRDPIFLFKYHRDREGITVVEGYDSEGKRRDYYIDDNLIESLGFLIKR